MHSDKIAEAFAADSIEVFDDIIQLLSDAGHEDLVDDMHSILCIFDSRRVRAA
jgi:hypothetical protein